MLSNSVTRTIKKVWRFHYYSGIPTRLKAILGVLILVFFIIFSSRKSTDNDHKLIRTKVFSVHGKNADSGYLKHVFKVFSTLGYNRGYIDGEWDILWSHDYPFTNLKSTLENLKPHQMVNHIPGTGYITNKMNLARIDLPYIPQAFLLPKEMDQLLIHKTKNPKATYILKSNNHRGIHIVNDITSLKNSNNSFAQLYVSNPLLIDNHKFDIGVYTFITSINPLRVYIFTDVLFRFCPDPYEPFNASNVNKYVVGDDYQPIWQTVLGKYYSEGYSMKNSFDAHIKSIGKDPETIWTQVDDAIRSVILAKEPSLIQSGSRFKHGSFFELMRFDFVIDRDFNVFLMEANMSPNLSSKHFPPNQQLYEQVLFALFSTIGLAYGPVNVAEAKNLLTTTRQKMTNGVRCGESDCMGCPEDCSMCSHCLSDRDHEIIEKSIREHYNRVNTRRVFPPAGKKNLLHYDASGLTKANKMLIKWFYNKCVDDPYFCN